MTALTNMLSAISSVFTTYVPALATGIYTMFINVFCVTSEGAVTGLNELGYVAIGFIGVGLVSGIVATVLGVLRLRKRKGSIRNRRK